METCRAILLALESARYLNEGRASSLHSVEVNRTLQASVDLGKIENVGYVVGASGELSLQIFELIRHIKGSPAIRLDFAVSHRHSLYLSSRTEQEPEFVCARFPRTQ